MRKRILKTIKKEMKWRKKCVFDCTECLRNSPHKSVCKNKNAKKREKKEKQQLISSRSHKMRDGIGMGTGIRLCSYKKKNEIAFARYTQNLTKRFVVFGYEFGFFIFFGPRKKPKGISQKEKTINFV